MGECTHAHVFVIVQFILFSPSQSCFYQAHLPCCPHETVERLHQIFKMFSKNLLFFFFLLWMFASSDGMELVCGKKAVLSGFTGALVLKC